MNASVLYSHRTLLSRVRRGALTSFFRLEPIRQIREVSEAFARAHEPGMVIFPRACLRNAEFRKDGLDYHTAADLTGQANHLAATIEADIVRQKQAGLNGGYIAIKSGKIHPRVYAELTSDQPIDLVR